MAGKTGKTNKQWLADNAARPGIHTTPSGLQYEIITSGPATGTPPGPTAQVQVNYKGTLVDGDEFDSSKSPTTFGVNGVIAGWTEALQLMRPGDKWRLFIPPELGYKDVGQPPKIGSNAILIFETELLQVLPPAGVPEAPAPALPAATVAAPAPAGDAAATPAAVAPTATPAAVAPAATPAATTP
jgi:peptidylprolyl isomerase/FKBP-type peptidyl-prolyl cis-trans isomerase FklB